ncbi:hypothetical protein [Mesorhizobium sp.]|uniref:hypothetical protein n=1 Tax=Mesorhizobium sp. TaxID=1871066 RepID=UPI000FD5E568|nr:hypothetical protein [Mesorhizobium sp.]RVC64390.1 hypothetical protein EN779_02035 [Mesorhizobium sp. M4B.F.Ca.ET.088.02.2.1]RWF27657.1 MAG: hypothetical protein EOS45_25110 [Mesorhizobium sp.]
MDKRALFFEDGNFAFPLFVKSIASVPEDYRDCYNSDPAGDYKLKDLYWNELRLPFEREYEKLEREMSDLKAKHEKDVVAEKQARKQDKIDSTLHSACKGAGIPDGLMEGAIAILTAKATFEVDESYEFGGGVVIANSGGHLNSVEGLVENFLDSDEGAGFRGKRRAAPSDGYFTALLSGMKERR